MHRGRRRFIMYCIQLFFRRWKRGELMWGDGDYHRENVAEAMALQQDDSTQPAVLVGTN
jgi:hypothetical protein